MNATRDFLILAGTVLALGTTSDVRADFTFGAPVLVKSDVYGGTDYVSCISYDGLEMYIANVRSGGQGGCDIWVLKRASKDEDWSPAENLGPAVNSPYNDLQASISADGLTLYFDSDRPYGDGVKYNAYVTTRATKNAPWGPAAKMGPEINGSGNAGGVGWISPDGLELYVDSWYRSGGYGRGDIYVARRATVNDPWTNAVNLGPLINTSSWEWYSALSPDGLLLLFCDLNGPRPGGYGAGDLWMARRATLSDAWQAPVNLGPTVNGPANEFAPRISPDGRTLYFVCDRSGGFGELMQAPIIPNCDCNGDGKVDANDLALLVADWGKSNSVCDIGPFAWGDGVVDEKDLKVLMASLMTPGPKASDVPCDVVLSWISRSFASTCDVYLGTSQEAVNTASRANPQGVLVSQGQTTSTYDPAGLLAFSQTYYWRIDFVIPGPTPTIYQGPVLDFTTEAFAYPIKNVTAKASTWQAGMDPQKTVDASGLDKNDGHSTVGADMWLSMIVPPHWIQYQFENVYALHELWVWNSNSSVEPVIGFGAKSVKIEYSTDGTTWTRLEGVPEFARAPGQPGYTANTTVSFGGVSAKYVKLTIEKGWGSTPSVGLSEVRFFYIPDRPATKP